MLGQQRLEQRGPDPFEALLVVGDVLLINSLRTGQSVRLHVNFIDHLHHAVEQVFLVALDALRVFVDAVGVQQASIEHAYGQVEPVLDGVEVDAVAKNVTVNRLQKREARRLQALEKIGPAKTHQPLAGTAQVVDELALGCGGVPVRNRVHIVAQAVARNMQRVDVVHHRARVEPAIDIQRVSLVHCKLQ